MARFAVLKSPASPSAPAPRVATGLSLSYAMLTHPGRIRHSNQDACAARPEHGAFVVCDGVGGAAGGEIASHLATESFLTTICRSATALATTPRTPEDRLREAVVAANSTVFQRAQRTRSLRGMATTLVAALLEDRPAHGSHNGLAIHAEEHDPSARNLWLAHAGDSRAYRLRRTAHGDGAFLQLTCDHSLVEEQIHAGLVARADAARSPVRNVITRAVGSTLEVEPEIACQAVEPGDLYLLASDGLTRELDDDTIARLLLDTLAAHDPDPGAAALDTAALDTAAQALVDAANAHGGRDNITVLLLAIP